MKRLLTFVAALASLSLGGCATTSAPGEVAANTASGAAAGAAKGAVIGSAVPGVGTTAGAVAGAVAGGIAGAVIGGRQYYRDSQGHCYYVDANGQPQYDNNVTC